MSTRIALRELRNRVEDLTDVVEALDMAVDQLIDKTAEVVAEIDRLMEELRNCRAALRGQGQEAWYLGGPYTTDDTRQVGSFC